MGDIPPRGADPWLSLRKCSPPTLRIVLFCSLVAWALSLRLAGREGGNVVYIPCSVVKKCAPEARKSSKPIWSRELRSTKVRVLYTGRLSPSQAANLWQSEAGSE